VQKAYSFPYFFPGNTIIPQRYTFANLETIPPFVMEFWIHLEALAWFGAILPRKYICSIVDSTRMFMISKNNNLVNLEFLRFLRRS
jgi:hypothetical protein